MARYTVVWHPALVDEFTEYWIAAESALRQVLSDIANKVDQELSRSPDHRGYPVPDDPQLRTLRIRSVKADVSVVFRCFPEDRTVQVIQLKFSKG